MPYPKLDAAGNPILPRYIPELKLIDFEERLVSGDLTADGVQYSSEVTSGGADAWTDALSKIIDPDIDGDLLWAELGLTAEFQQLNGTTTLTWQWQARNKDGTWVDLHTEVTESANTITSYTARTRQGFNKKTNFDAVPCEVKLRFKTSEANQGKAKVKSSSYVRVVYKAT